MLFVLPAAAAADSHAWLPAWTTYRHDAARSGVDPDSTVPVRPRQVWQSASLDGRVFGEPLVYGKRVYVATENDTVYALNVHSGHIIWQNHLATAVDARQLCGSDILPTVGITSTPVIDPSTGRIYVVADTWDGSDRASIDHQLFALNLRDGTVAQAPSSVEPPGDLPYDQLQRASLALDDGRVLIGYGANYNDCGYYHGWLVSVSENGGPIETFEADAAPGESGGSIWASGNGPSIDSSGDVWIATGNGDSTTFDFQESVIKLDAEMHVLDYWAPSYWQYLDERNLDVGSSFPTLLPDGLVYEIGKLGTGYLMSQASLGGLGGKTVYDIQVCPGSWGGAIYYSGVIYATCRRAGLYALSLNTTTRRDAPLPTWTVDPHAVGPPIYAGGLIWSANFYTGYLYALDPITGAEQFSVNLGGIEHFGTPGAGAGLLFMPNQDQSVPGADQLTAFRIAKWPVKHCDSSGHGFARDARMRGRVRGRYHAGDPRARPGRRCD
jgi:outer membrane protein assembly factor BamB